MRIILLLPSIFSVLMACTQRQEEQEKFIMTVTGPIPAKEVGLTLEHEHVATDFIGAEKVIQPQYDVSHGSAFFLPHMKKLTASGVQTLIECTPKYIGRDVGLLKELAVQSGLQIITNTGYYAAANKKYLPAHAYTESAGQLAARWIDEWKNGIDGTEIKPGFIKLGVGKLALDSVEQKLVRAGALTHLETGLKIAIHTGSARGANDELDILAQEGVDASALIVVHAQNSGSEEQLKLLQRGCWLSLDGVKEKPESIKKYSDFLISIKDHNLLAQVLISHDDGWSVIQGENGNISFELFGSGITSPYSSIFDHLIPRLREMGFSQEDIDLLLIKNPAKAFAIEVCRRTDS